MAKSLVPEDQLSAIEHSGNQRLTYLSFSQESQMTSKFKEEEISALMLLAFKLSKQAGNAGRLFIKGDTSHEKFYCKFLKRFMNQR
ncbi:MAG: hypothetical protein HWD61_04140 [Parachlamydiaceae bacterium]|nr:MAG: hypothetical protein HWD61_04140 [Parachlamydiaceae bacterium]